MNKSRASALLISMMIVFMLASIIDLAVDSTYASSSDTATVTTEKIMGKEHSKEPSINGAVLTIDGLKITIKGKDTSYTVDVSGAKIFKVGPSSTDVKKTVITTITASDIQVGDMLRIQGTLDGTSMAATKIIDGKRVDSGIKKGGAHDDKENGSKKDKKDGADKSKEGKNNSQKEVGKEDKGIVTTDSSSKVNTSTPPSTDCLKTEKSTHLAAIKLAKEAYRSGVKKAKEAYDFAITASKTADKKTYEAMVKDAKSLYDAKVKEVKDTLKTALATENTRNTSAKDACMVK